MSPSKRAANGPDVYLALGSNLGDRAGHLRGALEKLRADPEIEVVAESSVFETAAMGIADAPPFLNCAVRIRTSLEPLSLLSWCHATERAHGRNRSSEHIPRLVSRTLDIDILAYGERIEQSQRLTLPHPRITERPFVLVPLCEIAPRLVLGGRTVRDWLLETGDAGVRRVEDPG